MSSVKISISIPKEAWEWVCKRATEQRVSRSTVIANSIRALRDATSRLEAI